MSCEDEDIWPKERYYDDAYIEVNGQDISEVMDYNLDVVPDDAVMLISGGCVFDPRGNIGAESVCAFDTLFNRWKKKQTHKRLTVEIPLDEEDSLKSLLKTIKGKIIV
jgi:hypothetical protein